MTMIEKVARALYPGYDWMKENNHVDIAHRTAKAAIEAMREPTDEMQMIYYELNHKCGTFDVSTWERSIDAALQE